MKLKTNIILQNMNMEQSTNTSVENYYLVDVYKMHNIIIIRVLKCTISLLLYICTETFV